jgi:predicted secreted hydrolase
MSAAGSRAGALLVVAAVAVAACGGPILADPQTTDPVVVRPTPVSSRQPDPHPIALPADDGPHDRLTEWWYDTGHLVAADGRRFGFELVVFRAERGDFPVSWASHLALTDEAGDRFLYDQRSEVGGQVDRSVPAEGFDLAVSGQAEPGMPEPWAVPWTMAGADGIDRLTAMGHAGGAADPQAAFGIELSLDAQGRAPAFHDGDGYVDFGVAGGSYYYSRTRMAAEGWLVLDGERVAVSGSAWFDHQWGDFISVGGGGWDWFAVNLEDGADLTLSLVRGLDGSYPLVYGTLVRPAGAVDHLPRESFTVEVRGHWTSPATGAEYPAAWRITLPTEDLVVDLVPTVADQELDTRETTGVVYWEGSQVVHATRGGTPLGGEAYVELTGYGPGVAH